MSRSLECEETSCIHQCGKVHVIAELPCSNYMECKRMVPPCILEIHKGQCMPCAITTNGPCATAGACVATAAEHDVCTMCNEMVHTTKTMPFACMHAVCVACVRRMRRYNVRRQTCPVCKARKGHMCTSHRAGYVAFVSTAMNARGMSVEDAVCAWHSAYC